MSDEQRENKNAVFAGANSGGMIEIARQLQNEQMRTQMGLNLPVNSVPLPSRGWIYPQGSALCNQNPDPNVHFNVDLKAMTTQEENILTSRALIKKGTVITELIKSCLVDKKIDVSEMLSGDRNALMVAIRSEGYGNVYQGEVKCANCDEKFKQDFDLNTFPFKFLDITPIELGKNEFAFEMPASKAKITFKFLTAKDEEDILATQESKKKLVSAANPHIVDDSLSLQLQYSILSVNGDRSKGTIATFVRNMRARDSIALRSYMNTSQPGLEMVSAVTCPHCNHVEERVGMPIGTTFFWPNA